jgi:hypothetical protein
MAGPTLEERIAALEQGALARPGPNVPLGSTISSDTSQAGGVGWVPAAGSYVASMYAANSGSPTQTLNGDYQKLGSGGGTLTWVSEIDKRPAGVSAQVDTATNKRLDVRASGLYDVKWSVIFATFSDGRASGAAIYKNGTQVAQATTDQGTGDFLAYPINLGFRSGGSDLFFNGQLFGLITSVGPNLASTNINATEYWLNEKTGAI